jgi:hypothetical protein
VVRFKAADVAHYAIADQIIAFHAALECPMRETVPLGLNVPRVSTHRKASRTFVFTQLGRVPIIVRGRELHGPVSQVDGPCVFRRVTR